MYTFVSLQGQCAHYFRYAVVV